MLVGSAAGIINAVLLYILTMAAVEAAEGESLFKSFAMALVCLIGFWWSKRYILNHTRIIVEEIIRDVRVRIADKIRQANLSAFERVGGAPFFNVVSTHASTISQAAVMGIQNGHSVVLVLIAFMFILTISTKAFLIVTITLGLLVVLFLRNTTKVMNMMRDVSAQDNQFVQGFQDLTQGFKELKMNAAKAREFFHDHYKQLAQRSAEMRIEAGLEMNKNLLIAHVSFFILLGGVIFLLPEIDADEVSNVIPVVAIVIYIFGPISEVVGAVPFIMNAAGSIQEIQRIERLLGEMAKDAPPEESRNNGTLGDFQGLSCEGISFKYPAGNGSNGFELGPIDFSLNAGELVFVIGGNGSGKSTFLKVLTGLYQPGSGAISVNGTKVTEENRQSYRDIMTPIFSDFHLFDQFFGLSGDCTERGQELISLMEISHKIKIEGKKISDVRLSTGQRKRLALLTAILENKDVLILDEWAAEQDPTFRRKFYREILPNLKSQGKTLLVITHDDKYFDVADRIIKMEYGKFVRYEGEHV